jgi:hypothetical protein
MIGQELRARYEVPQDLPHEMLTILTQLNRPPQRWETLARTSSANARASVHYEGYQEVIIQINDLAANYDKLADKAAARS